MVLRLLVAIGVLAVAAPLHANVIPGNANNTCGVVKTALQQGSTFPTVVATVSAMARQHLVVSLRTDREYVGAVLQDEDGRFWAAAGVACAGQDTVTFAVGIPPGLRMSAFWHTHGAAGPMREWFSPDDVALVATTGYDFYLITPNGALRVLCAADVKRTGRHPLRSPGPGLPRGATAGRTVVAPVEPDERVTTRSAPPPDAAA